MASFRVLRPTTRPVATGRRRMEEVAVAGVVPAVSTAAPRMLLSDQLASQPEDDCGMTTLGNRALTDAVSDLRNTASAGRPLEGRRA